MTKLLASVASISLLVGGIGIMNILLVSVTERTREIGIRMAVGAKSRHILLQFLVEAMVLSMVGGLARRRCSASRVATVIARLAGWPTLLSPAAIVGAFLFSGAVGVFFGFYPARKPPRASTRSRRCATSESPRRIGAAGSWGRVKLVVLLLPQRFQFSDRFQVLRSTCRALHSNQLLE